MRARSDVAFLRYALVVVGVVFVAGIWILMQVWPSGWVWQPAQPEYEQMIIGIYATLGVFLLRAARDPLEHLSLIWFTVWSSLVHGAIMLWQALRDPVEAGHLTGDVPAIILVGLLLAWLTRRATTGRPGESRRTVEEPATGTT
ncbi:MAG: hypothetical protein Q8W44_03980 [Candidatus Palauibacterales bacterium]|nr:hypothetical protein [Candidatus Palauibacterales bacterium]